MFSTRSSERAQNIPRRRIGFAAHRAFDANASGGTHAASAADASASRAVVCGGAEEAVVASRGIGGMYADGARAGVIGARIVIIALECGAATYGAIKNECGIACYGGVVESRTIGSEVGDGFAVRCASHVGDHAGAIACPKRARGRARLRADRAACAGAGDARTRSAGRGCSAVSAGAGRDSHEGEGKCVSEGEISEVRHERILPQPLSNLFFSPILRRRDRLSLGSMHMPSRSQIPAVSAALVASLLCIGTVAADADTPLPQNASLTRPANAPRVIMGSTHHRRIHFTFDDGPEPRTTPAMLQALDDLHVKATFFLSAWRLDANRRGSDERARIAEEILRRGHSVASHSFQHVPMPPMSEAAVVDQIERSGSILTRVVGFRPVFFRPPHGLRSARVDAALAQRDYTTVIWNLNPTDYSVRDAQTVLHHFNNMLRYRLEHENVLGGIVLMHDTHMWSVEGFRLIYNELMTRNCALLQSNEELFDIVDTLEPFLYPDGQEPASLGAEHDAHVRAVATAFCAEHSRT